MHKNDRAAQRMPLALKKSPFRDSRNNRVASSHGSCFTMQVVFGLIVWTG